MHITYSCDVVLVDLKIQSDFANESTKNSLAIVASVRKSARNICIGTTLFISAITTQFLTWNEKLD